MLKRSRKPKFFKWAGLVGRGKSFWAICFVALSLLSIAAVRAFQIREGMICLSNIVAFERALQEAGQDIPYSSNREMIEALTKQGILSAEMTRCPTTGKDYVIALPMGSGKTPDSRSILIYEPFTDEHGEGSNAVFLGGHARSLTLEEYRRLTGKP